MRTGPALTRGVGWRTAALAATAAVLLPLLAVLVDPTLLRPLIRHYVQSHSQRAIDFSALRFRLGDRLQPQIEFDDLVIENTPWATSREPFVQARRVGLALRWGGLASGAVVVERVLLEDGAVDLERDASDRRNSRLTAAEGRGPPRVRVLSIDGRRSRLRIVDAMTGLSLQLASTPLAAPRTLAGHAALPLTRTLRFDGSLRGTPFSGQADVSDTVTLQRSGQDFALDGEIRTGAARLTVSGVVADLQNGLKVDADLRLEADPLSGLLPGVWPRLPALRRISADGHLVRDAGHWALTRLRATSRGSEIGGTVGFRRSDGAAGRARFDVSLQATRLDVDEWLEAQGATQAAHAVARKAAGPAAVAKPASAPASAPDPAAPPATAFDWTGLGRYDAAVDLQIAELRAGQGVVARDMRMQASLAQARLQLSMPAARLLGGSSSASVRLDAAATPATVALEAQVDGGRLSELPPAWQSLSKQVAGGRVSATTSLALRGRSRAEWIASASGHARVLLDGATVSDRLEAKLGLDGFAFLRSLWRGPNAVPVRCAEAAFDLRNGVATVRRLTLDTDRTQIAGSGTVDLAGARLDLLLAPSSKVDTLFALDRDIRIRGPFGRPQVSLPAPGPRTAPMPCPGP